MGFCTTRDWLWVGFGNCLLCAAGNLVRLEPQFADVAGTSATTTAIHTTAVPAAADVRVYQVWCRDNPTFGLCTSGYNLSSALSLTWAP